MGVIMSATVGEFFAFQLPMSAVVLATICQTLSVQSNMVAIGYCLWFIDATVNPLWTTFLSQKQNEHSPRPKRQATMAVTKIPTVAILIEEVLTSVGSNEP